MRKNKLLLLLVLLLTAATGAWAQEPATTYSVKMKEGTVDAKNWSIASGEKSAKGDAADGLTGLSEKDAVTLTYTGRLKVKGVKATSDAAPAPAVVDLSMLDCAGNLRPRSWTANCYMVHSAGDYKLPLVYGNAIKNGATNSAAYTGVSGQLETFLRHDGSAITAPWIKDNGITVATAELLWQDAEGLITNVGIDGDYLTLTVGKDADAQEGNAVVAAKDGSGNIVWSWHIWVTKQTFANLTSVATGSHTYQLTPVNLGWVGDAVSRGYNTFYQWGRKDPFIPTTGTANTNHTVYNISNATVTGRTYSTSSATIADNIKNPTTFYSISDKPNTSTAYNLWDAQQTSTGNIATATVKTVYDPCPAGFCVPTGNLYYYIGGLSEQATTWDGTNKGQNLTSVSPNVFFPSSGCHQQTGGIYGVGNYGYYWSASPNSSSRGQNLDTQSGAQGLLWQNYLRANGFTVRPVADDWEPAPAPAAPALNITSPSVGQVIGSDGKNYAYGSLPTGVTKVAMIAYVSGTSGLAIALADEEVTMNWATAKSTCEAKTPAFTNGTWLLPSQDEWKQMFSANGGSDSSYSGLNTAITAAGGTALEMYKNYWSSTPDGSRAYYAIFTGSGVDWQNGSKTFSSNVRACLAF